MRALFLLCAAPALLAAAPAPLDPDDPLAAILHGEKEPDDSVFTVALSDDGRFLKVEGDIELGAYRKFKRVFEGAKSVKSIWLDSGGGLVLEAFLIAALVREAKLDTYVESNCASACTLIMASGVNRTAYARAKIGFHNSIDLDKKGNPVTGRAERKANAEPDFMQAAAFYRAGIDPAFVDRALATPNRDIWEPSHKEMIAAHALTRTIDDKERLGFKGWGTSWPELRDTVAATPLGKLVRTADEPLFDTLISTSWEEGQKAEGGAAAFAERALLSRVYERIVDAPPALSQRFLALWAKAPKGKGDAPHCGVSGMGESGLGDMFADGINEEEASLIRDALSNTESAPLQTRRATAKAVKAVYDVVDAAVVPHLKEEPQKQVCIWDRKALAHIATLPPDAQAATLIALQRDASAD